MFTDPDTDPTVGHALESAHSTRVAARAFARRSSTVSREPSRSNITDASSTKRQPVVVVDEARSLLTREDHHGVNYFQLLRGALTEANGRLASASSPGRVFAVLIDTKPQIPDFAPRVERDLLSRRWSETSKVSFPPFVLTHTMDVKLGSSDSRPLDYKASVSGPNSARSVWDTLLSMGRPLWKSDVVDGDSVEYQQASVIDLAISKLLVGLPPEHITSYDESTVGGVASLLCRLGLRPHASSAFSARAVPDFMATLSYVAYKNDAHISNYPSEPVLAFGATRLWYRLSTPALSRYMLPQFRDLLMQGVVDTGDIGEIVARIFLLLAMDASVVPSDRDGNKDMGSFLFAGQFCSVTRFLDQLAGESPDLRNAIDMDAVAEDRRKGLKKWISKWKSWKVGFSRFV